MSARTAQGRVVEVVALYAGCGLAALVISGLIVEAVGADWSTVGGALLDGSVRKPGRWGGTIGVTVPLAMVAIGTIISTKVGLVNIGQEGQLLVGAAFATFASTRIPGPGPIVLVAILLAGIVGGAIWSGLAGGLRYWRKVPEVLTTLLLVSVASNLVGYGLKKPWLLLDSEAKRGNRNLVSEQLPADTRMPRITLFGNDFAISAFLAIAVVLLIGWMLNRTLWGYRLTVVGHNRRVARRFGISESVQGMVAMLASGGFAGLAGALMLTGGDFANYRMVSGFSVSIGWVGLLVALVANNRALAVIPMAFVFASLRTGSGFLASTGIERRVTDVVQGLIVLALLLPPAIMFIRERRRALAAAGSRV
ncbi:MAG: ABC transporter permease [Acidimicrobiia bacterium]|nr:ABC transporter permease [Actinomycetota bacterium]MBL6924799.1 ABC transporter permease [Acidimicrobiia bacterium]MBL6925724.1 ABC transporter permease [Acidimicrobiia bacterium]